MTMATTKKIGMKGKVIHSQGREIIADVLRFMKDEAAVNSPVILLTNFKERLLRATGISKNTYASIAKEAKDVWSGAALSFSTPHKRRPRESPKNTLRDEEKETLRSIIHNTYIVDKRRPTLKGIHAKIIENGIPFTGGLRTLSMVLSKMGFKWQKSADKRAVLMESCDIRAKRIKYLRQLQKYVADERPIIFTDESYIHSSHTMSKEWSDGSNVGLKKTMSKGARLIMVRAGGKAGFVPNALLMFKSGCKSGDYHDGMNSENFFKWVNNQLLPNLPPRSVLVLDNASYHNIRTEYDPSFASKKAEMVEWLAVRGIEHDPKATKPELYELIKTHKTANPKFQRDELMWTHGHSVLRLPPYYPELNPIEKIWATVKNWVAARNVIFKMDDVESLTKEKFSTIYPNEWFAICSHVDKIVEEYIVKEHLIDEFTEEFEFTVNTGESDNDFLEESTEEEGEEKGRTSGS